MKYGVTTPSDTMVLAVRIAELEAENAQWKIDRFTARKYVKNLEAKVAELENLIADLQCTGVYCGLDGCLCDNCRIRLKVFGDK